MGKESPDEGPKIFDATLDSNYPLEDIAHALVCCDYDEVWVTPVQIMDAVKEIHLLRKTVSKLAARIE